MHVAYAFCPAFFAAARRRWLISCQLLRPEPRLIDRSRRKLCIPYSRHFDKSVKSPYVCDRATDFDEIWRDDARWTLAADQPLKFQIFEYPRWRRPPSWKITKIAISPQRFDRSLRWCKMGFLTAPTVKKFEFRKSKMADGRHSENRRITISLQPFDRFWLNLARWCMLVPSAWRKVQIFNFRQCCWLPPFFKQNLLLFIQPSLPTCCRYQETTELN